MNKTIEDIIKEQMDNVTDKQDLNQLSQYAANLSEGISDHFTLDSILQATLNGESIFSSPELIESIKALAIYEVRNAMMIGIEILTICILIGLLKNLSGSFASKSTEEIASLICTIVIVGLALVNFQDIYTMNVDAIKTMVYSMEILLPVLIGILISMGQIASGTIFSPLMLTAITIFQNILKNVIIPAVFISCIFTLLNCLTEKDYVKHMAKCIRKAALFGTGLILTLASGVISIQGLITKTSDSLLMDTAKYSLDAFIPIVGGFTADTMDLFLTCMGSIKSIIGVFGIMTLLSLLLIPVIKTLAVACIYKGTSLLIEPVASKKLAEGVSEVGTALITLCAILFFSSLLFILFIASIMRLGGAT